jgi:hypothetical protein
MDFFFKKIGTRFWFGIFRWYAESVACADARLAQEKLSCAESGVTGNWKGVLSNHNSMRAVHRKGRLRGRFLGMINVEGMLVRLGLPTIRR